MEQYTRTIEYIGYTKEVKVFPCDNEPCSVCGRWGTHYIVERQFRMSCDMYKNIHISHDPCCDKCINTIHPGFVK